jgi:hypothetical protein
MKAAAKRRSQAEVGCGVGPRREVYGALAGRLIAEQVRSFVPTEEVDEIRIGSDLSKVACDFFN